LTEVINIKLHCLEINLLFPVSTIFNFEY